MMEAARTSETMVNFYQTTRRYNPKDSHLRNEENPWSGYQVHGKKSVKMEFLDIFLRGFI
jgi:hypothetical protein